jgi:predicted DNA-binding transcriptional regulator AlpA
MEKKEKKYLLINEIKDVFPFLSRSTVLNLIENNGFPKGKNITPGEKEKSRRVWSVESIEKWLDDMEED